jgi:hypothetical protein
MKPAHVDDGQQEKEIQDATKQQDDSKLSDNPRDDQLHPRVTESAPASQHEHDVAGADDQPPLGRGCRQRTQVKKDGYYMNTEAQKPRPSQSKQQAPLSQAPVATKGRGIYPRIPPKSLARGAPVPVPSDRGKQAQTAGHDGEELVEDQGNADDSDDDEPPKNANPNDKPITSAQMATQITRLAKSSFDVAEAFERFLRQPHPKSKHAARDVMTALDKICDGHRKRKAENDEAEAGPSRKKGKANGKAARKGKNK